LEFKPVTIEGLISITLTSLARDCLIGCIGKTR